MNQQRLKELLNYDPVTGVFTNTDRRSTSAKPYQIAGSLTDKGYLTTWLDNRHYRLHRLAWVYVYGVWPTKNLDHINQVKSDNRVLNLREATSSENMQNVSNFSHNTSGHKGITWHKQAGKWNAKIKINGRNISMGVFDDINQAIAARKLGETIYHTHGVSA